MKLPTVLIIKTGSTYRDLRKKLGDFETWIQHAVKASINWKVQKIEAIEPYKIPQYQGIIIAGSHNSLCFPYPYLNGFRRVLDQVLHYRIFTLGICFGHQLLHKLCGGEVIRNPLGTEIGVNTIQRTLEGLVDPLFNDFKKVKVEVYQSHTDIVSKPAPDSVVLAWNSFSEYQATRIGAHIYSVQFHPEYNRQIMGAYILHNWSHLAEQQRRNPLHISSPETIQAANKDLRHPKLILRNFLQMIG